MKNNTPFQFSFDNFPYVLVWQLLFARLDTAFITDYKIVFSRRWIYKDYEQTSFRTSPGPRQTYVIFKSSPYELLIVHNG